MEKTKSLFNMHTKLRGAVTFLEHFCEKNSVELKYRTPESVGDVLIFFTPDGKKASVGIDRSGDLKCYFVNPSKVKWARLEGFSKKEISSGEVDGVVEDISLRNLASFFVSGNYLNYNP
jgi:hypothetical protein